MSRTRSQNLTGPGRTRNAKKEAADEDADVCELLVAELQARRVRLQELLSLVIKEVEGTPASPVKLAAARTHSRRHPVAMKQIA